ncbi:MAG: type III-A CRISPR-associated protein Cas10/Csm1 [Candidatus Atribacteria bacterium]|nr:type III-A CRISPR-associated protein Cas10/Csm1 [Candidatus Atribacteria bacterium]
MNGEQFVLGALLHDVGKALERCRYFDLPENLRKEKVNHVHAKYSAFLIQTLRSAQNSFLNPRLKDLFTEEVEKLVLFHHDPRTPEELILQIADWISAAEREEDEENLQMYYKVPLLSIFSQNDKNTKPLYYTLKPLDYETLMPTAKDTTETENYKLLMDQMLTDFPMIDTLEKLLGILEIYFSSVPAQTTRFKSDISLFDHLRVTAALAHALYLDWKQGILETKDFHEIKKWILQKDGTVGLKDIFLVVEGDLSGIQNFIFNIPSKKAARSLKGRSVYLDLIPRYVAKYILDQCRLTPANILYVGGGNFQLLLPCSCEDKLIQIRKKVTSILWGLHQGEIAFTFSSVKSDLEGIFSFPIILEKLHDTMSKEKQRRFWEIKADLYDQLFVPKNELIQEREHCVSCGRKGTPYEDQGEVLCPICQSLVELTNTLKNAKYLVEKRISSDHRFPPSSIFDFFVLLGYNINFVDSFPKMKVDEKIYRLESMDLHAPDQSLLDGFLSGSFSFPKQNFDQIALTSLHSDDNGKKIGSPRLAYLKMDLDNLGKLFSQIASKEKERSGEATSFSRIRTLSRRIELFFNFYLVHLIRKYDPDQTKIYPVFVGGDDLFIVGNWEATIDLARKIRESFQEYTGKNPMYTLSGGMVCVPYDYPVIRTGSLVEEALGASKNYLYPGEDNHVKDKVTVFKETLTWSELKIAWDLGEKIANAINQGHSSRALIHKISNSLNDFNPLIEQSNQKIIKPPAIWNFLYHLRNDKEIADLIEEIILNNIFRDQKIRNPRLILVANRFAEMKTRKALI